MRVFRLARLAPRERHVIALLRGGDHAVTVGTWDDPFAQLHDLAVRSGFRLASPGVEYVTRAELCLLGVIAGLQRANPVMPLVVEAPVLSLAVRCARSLADAGVMLGHGSVARLTGMAEVANDLCFVVRPASHPVPGTVQARALAFVRSRDSATSRDSAEIGVSRQMVSLMFKRGLLTRVRAGVHRAATSS